MSSQINTKSWWHIRNQIYFNLPLFFSAPCDRNLVGAEAREMYITGYKRESFNSLFVYYSRFFLLFSWLRQSSRLGDRPGMRYSWQSAECRCWMQDETPSYLLVVSFTRVLSHFTTTKKLPWRTPTRLALLPHFVRTEHVKCFLADRAGTLGGFSSQPG